MRIMNQAGYTMDLEKGVSYKFDRNFKGKWRLQVQSQTKEWYDIPEDFGSLEHALQWLQENIEVPQWA